MSELLLEVLCKLAGLAFTPRSGRAVHPTSRARHAFHLCTRSGHRRRPRCYRRGW